MSNCNNYEKIKRSIEEENKKYKYCYIQGPTGPQCEKGDPGPSTVQIGKVETIEPNEKAEIVNAGTPVDVVLNFADIAPVLIISTPSGIFTLSRVRSINSSFPSPEST